MKKSEDWLLVNFCPNPDLAYISLRIAEGCVKLGGNATLATVVSRLTSRSVEVLPIFRKVSSSGFAQVLNVLPLINILFNARKAHTLIACSPSVLNLVLVIYSWIASKRLISVVHDAEPHYTGIKAFLYRVQTNILIRYSRIVYVFSQHSQCKVESISVELGINQGHDGNQRIFVLPLPSPAEMFLEETTRSTSTRGLCVNVSKLKKYDLIWFGRNETYKGVDDLVNIATKAHSEKLTLLVVCRFKVSDSVYRSLRKFSNVIVVNDYIEDKVLAELLSKSRLNICPYKSATQSGVISYATCLGVPSLVHDVGGLSEQIIQGVNGFIVDNLISQKSLRAFVDAACAADAAKTYDIYCRYFSSERLVDVFTNTQLSEYAAGESIASYR